MPIANSCQCAHPKYNTPPLDLSIYGPGCLWGYKYSTPVNTNRCGWFGWGWSSAAEGDFIANREPCCDEKCTQRGNSEDEECECIGWSAIERGCEYDPNFVDPYCPKATSTPIPTPTPSCTPVAPNKPVLLLPENLKIYPMKTPLLQTTDVSFSWQGEQVWGKACTNPSNNWALFVDKNTNPTTQVFATTNSLAPGTYYWKIRASNGQLSTDSDVWSFTIPACNPNLWGTPTTCSMKCGTGSQDITNQCNETVPQPCNTQACGPWVKLKDTSFVSPRTLTNIMPLLPTAYDADDTTEQYFIVGKSGVALAPAISLDISNITLTAKTGSPEYKALYTPSAFSMTPALFLSYVKARKEYKVITNLDDIAGSGIYVYNGSIPISSDIHPFNHTFNIVLIATGAVTINSAPVNIFTPAATVAIVAPTINFSNSLTEATGIFIGNTISTGTNAAQGLKIIGNLVAETTLSNNRAWAVTAKPSVFIKFDQTKYISLLPYLSMANYQWRHVHDLCAFQMS